MIAAAVSIRQRIIANRQRNRADAEAAIAKAVNEFFRTICCLSRLNLCRFIAFTRFDGAPMPLPGSNKVVF